MNKIFVISLILFTHQLLFAYNPDHLYQALSSKVCENCDLSKLNMKEGVIKEFNLPFLKAEYGTNLSNSHFAFSNLNGSDLRGMNLAGSDLKHSSLNGLYLSRSNLENVDLRYAQSSGSDYCRTNVKNVHFENANLKGAIFLDVKNISDAHCNAQTQLPAGYECINNKIKIVDCDSQKIIPIGYYCVKGNNTPQLLPIEGCPDELLENPDPRQYYNYFENIKKKVLKNGNTK